MSTEVGELTASVPGAAITRGMGEFATASGTETTGAGDRSAGEAFSAKGGPSNRTGSVPSVDTSSGPAGSSISGLVVTEALKICGDAATGFDLVLNRGRPRATRPRTKRTLAHVNKPTREVRLGIMGTAAASSWGTVSCGGRWSPGRDWPSAFSLDCACRSG